jgi:hypothetical protein
MHLLRILCQSVSLDLHEWQDRSTTSVIAKQYNTGTVSRTERSTPKHFEWDM